MALKKGEHYGMDHTGTVVHFFRKHDDEEIFVAINLSGEPSNIEMPEGSWFQIGQELGSAAPGPDGKLHLGPWQPALALRNTH